MSEPPGSRAVMESVCTSTSPDAIRSPPRRAPYPGSHPPASAASRKSDHTRCQTLLVGDRATVAKSGAITMSYGSAFNDFVFEFDCAQGAVTLNGDRVTVKGESFEVPFEGRGVNHEVAGFAASIRTGAVQALLRPEQALADLEVMEGIFTSHGARVDLRLQ